MELSSRLKSASSTIEQSLGLAGCESYSATPPPPPGSSSYSDIYPPGCPPPPGV
ncbi:unnamed protein product [Dibothriocephalus latus]|uniref:Uncharacterized protein n=1 Tax=Dibothriocephalus latus TaxID=60516 RepID=A0A3P7P791_DIBLA|nr:unnamed protein product [Dibothriocephalus latus]